MHTRNERGTIFWILLLVLCALVVAQRLSFEAGQLTWRSFGQARHSFAHTPCGIPIHVALGDVDPRFGFDRSAVSEALAEAERLWQAPGDAQLFLRSDHPRAMTVHLNFDERQHGALQRRSLRGVIDRDLSQLRSHESALAHRGARIEAARLRHERDSRDFARSMQSHQAQVAALNRDPARLRDPAQRQALEREGAALRVAHAELERSLAELNRDIAAYNAGVDDQQQQADKYRGRIAQFNTFSSEQPVVSGRYSHERDQGRRIAVFRAEDQDELVRILAHELGHALGLDHVAQPEAVMNSLLHEDAGVDRRHVRSTALGDADRAALMALCGDRLRKT